MGREIRMVPANWEHPKEQKFDYRIGRAVEQYKPLYDRDLEAAWTEWLAGLQEWIATKGDYAREKYGEEEYPKDEPYRSFCKWEGRPPNPDYYRPRWPEGSATWAQAYETVSEGTPVSPPFATREELIEYLVLHGDFWDQRRCAEGERSMPCEPWDREVATAFVNRGWASSMMVTTTNGVTEIKVPSTGA